MSTEERKDVALSEDADLKGEIVEWVTEEVGEESGVLLADGFEEAFLGLGQQFNTTVAVYDRNECLHILMRQGDMTEAEALEYFEHNVVGAYVGPQTPLFLTPFLTEYDGVEFADEDDGEAAQ